MFKKIINNLTYLFIFLLPLQTRLIYFQSKIKGYQWEYGTMSLYATEFILGAIIILGLINAIQLIPQNKQKNEPNWKNIALIVLFFIALLCNCLNALSPEFAFYKLNTLAIIIGASLVIIINQPSLIKIAWVFSISGLMQSLLGLWQFHSQSVFANKWLGMAAQTPGILGVPLIESNGRTIMRAFGSFPHPNMLAGFLVFAIVFSLYLYFNVNNQWQRISAVKIFTINCFGLIFTGSRTGILALAVALVCLLIFNYIEKNKIKALTYFLSIFILINSVFLFLIPNLSAGRFFQETRLNELSNISRINQYSEFNKIFSKDWFLGVGLNNYMQAESIVNPTLNGWEYQPIHNVFLLMLAELGLMGIFLVFFLAILLGKKLRDYKQWSKQERLLLPLVPALIVLGLFDHYLWGFYFGLSWSAMIISTILSANNNYFHRNQT